MIEKKEDSNNFWKIVTTTTNLHSYNWDDAMYLACWHAIFLYVTHAFQWFKFMHFNVANSDVWSNMLRYRMIMLLLLLAPFIEPRSGAQMGLASHVLKQASLDS